MVTVNENIRFYKPNDPYFYEVDNLPLIDLVKNDKLLADAINDILQGDTVFATEDFVQNAIDPLKTRVDLKGTGFTNIVDWVLDQPFGASTLADLNDVDLQDTPQDGEVLRYNAQEGQWESAGGLDNQIVYLDQPRAAIGLSAKAQIMSGYDRKDSPVTTPFYVGKLRLLTLMEQFPDPNTEADTDPDVYGTDLEGFTRLPQLPFATFSYLNIPANAKSVIINMYVEEAPHNGGRVHERETKILMQNGAEMLDHATGEMVVRHNELISARSPHLGTFKSKVKNIATYVEVPLSAKQIADQNLNLEILTTAKNVKDPLGYQSSSEDHKDFPAAYLEVIGYRT